MPFKLIISGVLQMFKKRKEEKIIWSTPDKNECRRGKNIWSTPDLKKCIEEKNIWCTPDHASGVDILPSAHKEMKYGFTEVSLFGKFPVTSMSNSLVFLKFKLASIWR